MNQPKLLVGAIIFLFIILFACEKAGISEAADFNKVADRSNSQLAKDYQAQSLFYNVTVLPQKNDLTYIAISDDNNRVHSLFGFQGEEFNLNIGKSTVEVINQQALKLTSKKGQSVLIALKGNNVELLKRHQASKIISEGIYGFISYPVIQKSKELYMEDIKSFPKGLPLEVSVIKFFTGELPPDNYACVTGGVGATDCSNSWCSVGCADGYWACCNMTCKCIDSDDPGWPGND